jgi:hypothetical protein
MDKSTDEINAIVEQLKADAISSPKTEIKTVSQPSNISDDNVEDYVYKKTTELVDASLGAVQTIRDTVLTGVDPREISSLAQLINATTKALDTLNQINLQNKQNKNNIEVKKLEMAAKDSLMSRIPQTTNVLIATRDEVMKQLFGDNKKQLKNKSDIVDIDTSA